MDLKVEDFIKLRNLIYDKAGIYYETNKIYFVKKRVEKRLKELDIREVSDYINHLKFSDKYDQELQKLLNILTINETYFNRDDYQLNIFINHCIPELLRGKKQRGEKQIKIWSAGCSSGEEPYSLAIIMMEKMLHTMWDIKITATDLDTHILEQAQKGVYGERSTRLLTPDILKKYFHKEGDTHRIKDPFKKMVNFSHVNLMDGLKMRLAKNFDFIFCRNVLIYFNEESRKAVVAHFYDSLNPGGYIFLGSSESLSRINTSFAIRKFEGIIIHQKPEK